MITASDIDSSPREETERQTLLASYSGAHIKDVPTSIKSICSISDNNSDDQSAINKTIPFNKFHNDIIAQYKENWGIPSECRLLGGSKTTPPSGNVFSWRSSGTKPVPTSATGTSNRNTRQRVFVQSPPTAILNRPLQQSPQSSNTSSNTSSQTSNIGYRGQNSNSGSASSSGATCTSQATNNLQNTTSLAQAAVNNLPASSGSQVSSNSSTTTTATATTSCLDFNHQSSSNSVPTKAGDGEIYSSTKQQLENFNTMREILYSQDGWGGQHVNQNTRWDVPLSPQPDTKVGPSTKLTGSGLNNGTDLWKKTLCGQSPSEKMEQNASKTSWKNTPISNIGGTWGEDDDVKSASGAEENTDKHVINPTTVMGNQWVQGQYSAQGQGNPMWSGPPKKLEPEDQPGNSGNTACNVVKRPQVHIDQGPYRRDILPNGTVDHSIGIGNEARGGVSGRLSGKLSGSSAGMEAMWGGPPSLVIATPGAKIGEGPVPGGFLNSQYNMNKYCDKANMAAANVRNNNFGNIGNQCPPDVPPNRTGMPPNKMVDQQLLQGNKRNGSLSDVSGGIQHGMNVCGPWGEDQIGLIGNEGGGSWHNSEWGLGSKSKNACIDSSNNDMDQSPLGQMNIGQKNDKNDYIWQSKSYRIIAEMGWKKEDVEAVTRNYNISTEDAIELLMSTRPGAGGFLDPWNSHGVRSQHPDVQNPFDRYLVTQERFNSQQFSFTNGNNSNQVMLQKSLAQQSPTQINSMQQQYCQIGSRQMQNQPTPQQLKMLVQQIQTAVEAGYLNHHILNQPLAPQTLVILNQLLQQIKILQQNLQIQAMHANNPKSGPAMVTVSIAIDKAKQQIAFLQNQIANSQAMHTKTQLQQSQTNLSGLVGGQGGDFFKNDPLTLIQSGFSDLAMNKDSQISGQEFSISQQQSRLRQWKLPNLDKDNIGIGNDLSRPPEANSQSTDQTSPTFNSLLNQGYGGWSDKAENKEVWSNDKSNSQSSSISSAYNTDLVPEFEPGKPWKNNQIKNIEDDPTITPGSVIRNPLSLAVTLKGSNSSDIFNRGRKTSTTNSQSAVDMPSSLSSSTWSYNPSLSSQSSYTNTFDNEPKNNWTDSSSENNFWGGVVRSNAKCPGLTEGSNGTGNVPNNGWPRSSSNTPSWQSSMNITANTWVLLKNLTQQVDGSILKTLCIQHGPLLNFHMYLNHGLVLVKYSSREEAYKAQRALNNCVLGNTTIFTESPTDAEVQMLILYLNNDGNCTNINNSVQQQYNWNNEHNGNGGNIRRQQGSDPWTNNQLWCGNNIGLAGNTSSHWVAGANQIGPPRTTSLNSFMPGDI